MERNIVSIPYEREGIFRHGFSAGRRGVILEEFQFPTSGKVSSDAERTRPNSELNRRFSSFNSLRAGRYLQTKKLVSNAFLLRIRFQFPTSGKVSSDRWCPALRLPEPLSFNSLRAGRYLQTDIKKAVERGEDVLFQFPTSGKVSSDRGAGFLMNLLGLFQFPTSGKVSSDRCEVRVSI